VLRMSCVEDQYCQMAKNMKKSKIEKKAAKKAKKAVKKAKKAAKRAKKFKTKVDRSSIPADAPFSS
jgi:hypothetical protein